MNIQYSDYRRFLASLGLALIVLSVTIPWFVLREPLLVDIKAIDINQLTLLGQYNVYLRQFMSLSLSVLSFFISPIFFFLGLIFMFIGVPSWLLKETWDEKEEAESRRIRRQIEIMEFDEKKNNDAQYSESHEMILKNIFKQRINMCFTSDKGFSIHETDAGENWNWGGSYDFFITHKDFASLNFLIKVKYTNSKINLKLLDLYSSMLHYSFLKIHKHARAIGVILHDRPGVSIDGFQVAKKIPLKNTKIELLDLSELELSMKTDEEFIGLFLNKEMRDKVNKIKA
jgi:hypothetical protein